MDCIYTAIFFIDRKSLQEGKINPQILVFFYFLNLTWEFLFFFLVIVFFSNRNKLYILYLENILHYRRKVKR